MNEYPATAAVGEVGDAQYGLEILGQYTTGDELMHMCYAFEFLSKSKPTPARVAEVLEAFDRVAAEGWACWAFSNHDVMRHATRWDLDPDASRTITALLLALRGSVCLYQGEELGLGEAEVRYEELRDPYGLEFWPHYKGRDGCRTPMVWSKESPHGGFSTSTPWLPVSREHLPLAVDVQERDPGSVLNHYRRLLAFRKAHPALVTGSLEDLRADGGVISFVRASDDETLYCAFNLSEAHARAVLPDGTWQMVETFGAGTASLDPGGIALAPWQVCFASRGSMRKAD